MNVDQKLINAAARLLHEHFPQSSGRACAAYSQEGRIFTGMTATGEAEIGPIVQAKESGDRIAALVVLARDDPRSPPLVRTPAPLVLQLLQCQARRHAQIAVAGPIGHEISVRPLWELIVELGLGDRTNTTSVAGRFSGGMKTITQELVKLAHDVGVPRARAEFSHAICKSLTHGNIRNNAATPALPGSKFLTPSHLASVSLRHIWLAFEFAAETFTFDVIDSLRPQLRFLGCNDADVIHIKQGFEALRNIFSVLLLFIGTRRQVLNECPFHPYDLGRLERGVPIDQYIPLEINEEILSTHTVVRNTALVRQLIEILGRRDEGGFASYLRQRELFKVDLFNGGGTGYCPFSMMSNEIIYATAAGLEDALNERIVMLAPDMK